MRRVALILALAAAALLGAGCSSSSIDTASLLSRMLGTWEIRRTSDDGGVNWDNEDNGFEFVFEDDGHSWNDTDGNEGTFALNGDRLTVVEDGEDNLNSRVRLSSSDNIMTLTYYTNDSFAERTGHVSEWVRSN